MRTRLILLGFACLLGLTATATADDMLDKKLAAHVTLNFKEWPLNLLIDDLRSVSDIEIIPDVEALERAGINLNHPLTGEFNDVALSTALRELLRPAKLTYVVTDGIVRITPLRPRSRTVPISLKPNP